MAALTWKNINAPKFDTSGSELALKAVAGAGESFEGAAQIMADRETVKFDDRTAQAMLADKQITDLAGYEASLARYQDPVALQQGGDFDVTKAETALLGLRPGIVEKETTTGYQDILGQRAQQAEINRAGLAEVITPDIAPYVTVDPKSGTLTQPPLAAGATPQQTQQYNEALGIAQSRLQARPDIRGVASEKDIQRQVTELGRRLKLPQKRITELQTSLDAVFTQENKLGREAKNRYDSAVASIDTISAAQTTEAARRRDETFARNPLDPVLTDEERAVQMGDLSSTIDGATPDTGFWGKGGSEAKDMVTTSIVNGITYNGANYPVTPKMAKAAFLAVNQSPDEPWLAGNRTADEARYNEVLQSFAVNSTSKARVAARSAAERKYNEQILGITQTSTKQKGAAALAARSASGITEFSSNADIIKALRNFKKAAKKELPKGDKLSDKDLTKTFNDAVDKSQGKTPAVAPTTPVDPMADVPYDVLDDAGRRETPPQQNDLSRFMQNIGTSRVGQYIQDNTTNPYQHVGEAIGQAFSPETPAANAPDTRSPERQMTDALLATGERPTFGRARFPLEQPEQLSNAENSLNRALNTANLYSQSNIPGLSEQDKFEFGTLPSIPHKVGYLVQKLGISKIEAEALIAQLATQR